MLPNRHDPSAAYATMHTRHMSDHSTRCSLLHTSCKQADDIPAGILRVLMISWPSFHVCALQDWNTRCMLHALAAHNTWGLTPGPV